MIERKKNGIEEIVDTEHPVFEVLDRLAAGTTDQIRGLVARLLRDAGVPTNQAAKVLRCSRSQFFTDLKAPFPGFNDDPESLTPARRPTRKTRLRRRKADAGQPDVG